MKVALACDFLTKFGGAQRVLLALSELFPDAPIHCLLYDEAGTKGEFKDKKIVQSGLGRLPSFLRRRPKFLLPYFPSAIEEFNFSDYDVVISSSDSFAHGVITKPSTFHVSYCHTPMRYVWDWHFEYLKENKIGFGPKGAYIRLLLHKIRMWDRLAADRVDKWLSNSKNVAGRINKFFQADATVVYPPVDVELIDKATGAPEEFYLIVSRLEPYKGASLAVEAFNKLGKKLVIIGEGSERAELEKTAKNNIEFLGWQNDKTVRDYFKKCKAFIFPVEDDFGIAPVEAMAGGRPVVAYGRGGALESVVEGKTGTFFDQLNGESLADAILKLEANYDKYTIDNCRKQAEKFSKKVFLDTVSSIITHGYENHLKDMQK